MRKEAKDVLKDVQINVVQAINGYVVEMLGVVAVCGDEEQLAETIEFLVKHMETRAQQMLDELDNAAGMGKN